MVTTTLTTSPPSGSDPALAFLYRRINYERAGVSDQTKRELRLTRMRRLVRVLGDPHDGPIVLHVTGTKGKGSTATMLAAILRQAGWRVGLYTSPHLHRIEERIRLDGEPIDPQVFRGLVEEVRPVVERLDRELGASLTFFEVLTAIAFLHFARVGAEIWVVEVGMGGRLDSTNIVRPAVATITSVSLDHVRILGDTPEAIAYEKAGIVKRRRPAVTGVGEPGPAAVIRRVARQRRAPLTHIGFDFDFEYDPPAPPLDRPDPGRARVWSRRRELQGFRLPLFGRHQAHNLAVTLATLDSLAEHHGPIVDHEAIRLGLEQTRIDARVETRRDPGGPWLVIDGCHNVASARALAETLADCFPPGSRTLVFGTSQDKDLAGQLEQLLPTCDRVVATRYVNNPRAVAPEAVARAVEQVACRIGWSGGVHIEPDPARALERARDPDLTPPDFGQIVVAGSLFLAAEAREVLDGTH